MVEHNAHTINTAVISVNLYFIVGKVLMVRGTGTPEP